MKTESERSLCFLQLFFLTFISTKRLHRYTLALIDKNDIIIAISLVLNINPPGVFPNILSPFTLWTK